MCYANLSWLALKPISLRLYITPLKRHRDSSEYVFSDHFSNMVNARRKHDKCWIWKRKLFDENQLEDHYQQYHPISMNEGLLPDRMLPPAGWDWPEPSWFDFSWCTWMAIDELGQVIHLPIDNVPGAPPPEDTPNEETIDPQKPDLPCTPDPTKTRANRQVVGVDNAGGTAYGKATRLYNKHRTYSEQWNPWHPFQSAHDFQQALSFSQQRKLGLINIWGVDWTTSTSNHFNQQMLYESSALDSISGLAMRVGLKIIRTSSGHCTAGILSNVYSSIWLISDFRHTSILNLCFLQTRKVTENTARWTQVIGGGIRKISYLLEWWLWQAFVHPTRPAWPIFWATTMPGRHISRSVKLEKISTVRPKSAPGFLLGISPVLRKVPTIRTRHGIPQLAQCCPHSGILTSLALACNGIVLMDSRDNVILCWLPGLGIIRNKSWLLKSHMAHAQCVKFLKVRRWGIWLFDHLKTHEISMFTWSFWTKLLSMFCTLLVFIQSATSSGNTLSAMCIAFGSLMNCISCSWV